MDLILTISCSLNVCHNHVLLLSGSGLTIADGFYLDENESEALYLDDIIIKDLSPPLQEELEFQQYYGYVYDIRMSFFFFFFFFFFFKLVTFAIDNFVVV